MGTLNLTFSPTYSLGYDEETWTPKSITCTGCGRTSHNMNDVKNRFCGFCNVFHYEIPIAKRMEWAAERKRQLKL